MKRFSIGLWIIITALCLLPSVIQSSSPVAAISQRPTTPHPAPAGATPTYAQVILNTDTTASQIRPSSTEQLVHSEVASGWVTILNEGFEGAFPGVWSVLDGQSGYGEYYWGKRSCRPYAGSYSGWAVGAGTDGRSLSCGRNYPDYVRSWMIYGPFSLADAIAADFSFKLWLNAETDYDKIFWGASIDGDQFSGLTSSGSTGGWEDRTLDLSNVYGLGNLLGQSQVWIALLFTSDVDTNYPEGAYVDDIMLRKYVSTATATPTPPQWPLLYQDDFSNPASGWPVGDDGCVRPAYQGGEYMVNVCPRTRYWAWRNIYVTDFDFSLDARYSVAQIDVSYGQVFRLAQGANAFYLLEVWPNGQAYAVWLYQDGRWSTIISEKSSSAIKPSSNKNVLRVVGAGANFQLYANGQLIDSFVDSTLPSGSAGLWVSNYQQANTASVAFDNYKLWGVAITQVTPTPTATRTRTPTRTLTPASNLRHVYLPALLRAYPPSVIANGGFESGDFSGWQHGGELGQRVLTDVVQSGRYAGLLGHPEAACNHAPSGQAWLEQEFIVPSSGTARLSIWYRLFTYDRNRNLVDTIDYFDILLNGERVLRDANRELNPKCDGSPPYDLGWREFIYDLSARRGQRIRIRMVLASTDQYYNSWAYVDSVSLVL